MVAAVSLFTLALPAQSLGQALADDFEAGTLLTTDSPPGPWTSVSLPVASNSLSVVSAAAHQGDAGLRLVDNDGDAGADQQDAVNDFGFSGTGDFYGRFWFRISQSNHTGNFSVLELLDSLSSSTPAVLDILVRYPGPGFDLGGWDSSPIYSVQTARASPAENTWMLIEVAILGMGTNSGARQLWMNGQLIAQTTPVDWSGASYVGTRLGEPWANDVTFVGQLDFDDVRIGGAPLASTLNWEAPSSAAAGQCLPATLQLVDSPHHALAPAPYPVIATLFASQPGVQFFSDVACTLKTSELSIAKGGSQAAAYLQATSTGTYTLVAQHPDFLTGQAALAVGAGGSPRSLQMGCGCQGSAGEGGLEASIMILATSLLRRRRFPRRAPLQ